MTEFKQKERIKELTRRHVFNATKLTAFTLSLVIPVSSFAQDSGCDTDDDCITVIGDPNPWEPIPIPPEGGNNSGSNSGGSSSSGGGSNDGSVSPSLCLALE